MSVEPKTSLYRRIRRRLFRPAESLEGYEHPELIETVFQKTVAFEPTGDWPLVAGVSSALDFGGGCGSHYKLAIRQSPAIRWAIVETPGMVARASELATERLRFFSDIDSAAAWLGEIDLMHSNGALQYTPDPATTLTRLCGLKAQSMYWARLWLTDRPHQETQTSYLSDNGPRAPVSLSEKIVRYNRTGISESDFLAAHSSYVLKDRGPDWFFFALDNSGKLRGIS